MKRGHADRDARATRDGADDGHSERDGQRRTRANEHDTRANLDDATRTATRGEERRDRRRDTTRVRSTAALESSVSLIALCCAAVRVSPPLPPLAVVPPLRRVAMSTVPPQSSPPAPTGAVAPAPTTSPAAGGHAQAAAKPAGAFSLTPKPLTLQPQPLTAAQPQPQPQQPQPIAQQPAQPIQSAPFVPQPFVPSPQPVAPAQPQQAAQQAAPAAAFSLQPKPLSLQPQPIQQQSQVPSVPLPSAGPFSLPEVAPQPVQSAQSSSVAPAVAASSGSASSTTKASDVFMTPGGYQVGPDGIPLPSLDPIPPVPMITLHLPPVDDDNALEQCQDWSFFVELVDDIFAEQDKTIGLLESTIHSNDHKNFKEHSHALKGAALNLHLPALSDITKKSEMVGKQLMLTPDNRMYLDARQPMIDHLKVEYARLLEVLPIYRQKAEDNPADEDGEEMPQFH